MLAVRMMLYVTELMSSAREARQEHGDRGDVAEKIIIVGMFVMIALGVGYLMRHDIGTEATKIGNIITGAP
jgi:hypothetical protein